MLGDYEYHDAFQPEGCSITINTIAATAGAGPYVSEIYYQLDLHNQTAIDGMGSEVTMGGYLTGGGHSLLSAMYGLGTDHVYQVEMVTPMGDIITANECQNTDLFWAVRGVSISSLNGFGGNTDFSGRWRHLWCSHESHDSNNSISSTRSL
jgi:FAD/FMN-containing dehydrogenase